MISLVGALLTERFRLQSASGALFATDFVPGPFTAATSFLIFVASGSSSGSSLVTSKSYIAHNASFCSRRKTVPFLPVMTIGPLNSNCHNQQIHHFRSDSISSAIVKSFPRIEENTILAQIILCCHSLQKINPNKSIHTDPQEDSRHQTRRQTEVTKVSSVRRWKDGDLSEFWSSRTFSECWLPEKDGVTGTRTKKGSSWFGLKETRWKNRHPERKLVKETKKIASDKRTGETEPANKKRKTDTGTEEKTKKKEPVVETKSKKWRIHPTKRQRKVFGMWFEAADIIYNKAAKMVNEDRRTSLKTMRSITKAETWQAENPARLRKVPYEIRDSPLRDLVKACKALRAKEKKLKRKFKLREGRRDVVSVTVRSRQLNCKKASGGNRVWPKLFGTLRDRSAMRTEKGKTLPLVFEHDCRLIKERKTGFYYLCFPVTVTKAPPSEEKAVVSIDPGVRTFATCFDARRGRVTEWGCAHTTKILYWLIRKAARLEKKSKEARGRHKKRITAVAARIRKRSTDLVNELHRKLALWLCENFSVVLLPKFSTQQMTEHQTRPRRLARKTAGGMVRLSHFKFRQFLLHKARENGTVVEICDEKYTSLTCGKCGTYNGKLGASKTFECPRCRYVADRDHNAARNILLRYVWKGKNDSEA